MAKKNGAKSNGVVLDAPFVNDTAKYHVFQIADPNGAVGSVYWPKSADIPKELRVQLLSGDTPERKKGLELLLINAYPKSKSYARIKKALG
jgi:hypothetical protein